MKRYLKLWRVIIHLVIFMGLALGDEQEYRLTRYLMSNYDPAVRPSQNTSHCLIVSFDLSLHHIIELNQNNQILKSVCRITQKWNDVHLRWNATDFGNVDVIRVPIEQVWRPDVVLYNNADPQSNSIGLRSNAIIKSNGDVTFVQHTLLATTCKINLYFFPFDVQTCSVKFVSLTYTGKQVRLTTHRSHGDLSDYQEHGEFALEDFPSILGERSMECCDEPSPDLTYSLRLRRCPLFYVFTLILPCIFINGVSIFTFYLPSESGEKITLSIGTLVCITVMILIAKETIPPFQKTPLIILYFGITICLVTCATIFSVVTLNLHFKGIRTWLDVPKGFWQFVLGNLAKLVCLNCGKNKRKKNNTSEQLKTISKSQDLGYGHLHHQEDESGVPLPDMEHLEKYNFSPRLRHRKEITSTSDISSDEFERQFLRVLNKVYETIEKKEIKIAELERREIVKTEWKKLAMVCDRLLLALFILFTSFTCISILLTASRDP